MKGMKRKFISSLFVAFGLMFICSSCEDMGNYDNKVFVSTAKVGTILLKGSDVAVMKLQTEIAKPEAMDVKVSYKADENLVEQYNLTYGEQAIIVPDNCYDMPEKVSTIVAGTVKGNELQVHFKNLTSLNRDLVYVLPITVAESNLDFLNNSRTSYFVIRGAALVNVAGNITENYLALKNPGTSTLSNMKQLTMELLVRVEKYGKSISTIMGIEGNFLFRLGDSGIAENQLQLATSSGNVTDVNWVVPTGEWIHLAATYNAQDGAVNLYLNGIKKGDTQYTSYKNSVNWGVKNFHIGKSWDNLRWLEGDICEVRVWERILSADELKAKNHFYMLEPDSEGLSAYWKFDEGNGKIIEDNTGNGNTLEASKDVIWTTVSLPK